MPEAQINQYHLLMALCNEKNVRQRLNKENLSSRETGHAIFSTFKIFSNFMNPWFKEEGQKI